MPGKVFDQLFSYQRRGVEWLWSVHNLTPTGGCLGVQTIAFITLKCTGRHGFRKNSPNYRFLVWSFLLQNNFSCAYCVSTFSYRTLGKRDKQMAHIYKFYAFYIFIRDPTISVWIFHGPSKSAREHALECAASKGGVCLTTYGMVLSQCEKLSDGVVWDYTFLDEGNTSTIWLTLHIVGHKIKNSCTQIAVKAHEIPSEHRILVSGTPVTNNLKVATIFSVS